MLIGGLQKFSLLDYPGHLSAIIFTQGCNLRCQFCYNPMLVRSAKPDKSKYLSLAKNKQNKGHLCLSEDDLLAFLKARRGKLEAVVITGGEPTIQPDLVEFLTKIKKSGYLVKLDTNGTNPEKLKLLIRKKLVDYIAMDIKASSAGYQKITKKKINFDKIRQSVKIIMASCLPYEFRTTLAPGLVGGKDLKEIAQLIKGADRWYLQQFKSNMPLVNPKLVGKKAFSQREMEEMAEIGRKYVKKCEIR